MLWCLDEYWHYSIFTLVMLIFFECTMAFTSLKTSEQLYEMEAKHSAVMAWRDGRWASINSDELLPGDLFALCFGEDKEETTCPCDAVLLAGSCVINEVKLTGESVPQRKESIQRIEDAERLLRMKKGERPAPRPRPPFQKKERRRHFHEKGGRSRGGRSRG